MVSGDLGLGLICRGWNVRVSSSLTWAQLARAAGRGLAVPSATCRAEPPHSMAASGCGFIQRGSLPLSVRRGGGTCRSLTAWARNGTVLLRPSGQSRCGHRTCSGSRGGDTDPVSMGRCHRICGLLGLHPCLSPSPFSSPDGPPLFYSVFALTVPPPGAVLSPSSPPDSG